MKPTPYDHFAYEYDELKPFFATVIHDPSFRNFDATAHRAHLEAYQRDYSFYFHNSGRERLRKIFRSPETERRKWHFRSDAYLAHLVQAGLVHRDTRDFYADVIQFLGKKHRHLERLCRVLVSDIYHGPRPEATQSSEDTTKIITFADFAKL